MLKQISIFAENQKGVMQKITGILQREDINILGSVTNDSAEYGIIRMVVSDADKAVEALTEENFICKLTNVLGIEVKDEVGNLNNLLLSFLESNINIDYLYLSFNRETGRPIMVIHVDDIMEVEACLRGKGFISL
ncbi:MAG TPA: amino acid-binding protein [Candidatus Blautia faecavium]|uniref:Amino acid-binding protein n=1 Tax=Candidatus Blautia faecavium TaxID=2838487 RepID=A0A9D2LPV7_9FIRM|nr:amino acid-binding protein [Candidatus Blautia faecavium]